MASLVNIIKNGNADFSGNWEDVQSYTDVKLTINSPLEGNARLLWSNGYRGEDIEEHIIATEDICYNVTGQALTVMRDHRARWFKLDYTTSGEETDFVDGCLNVECLYLTTPTGIKITDSEPGVVDVAEYGSFNVVLSGADGCLVSTTDNMTQGEQGNALYIHPVDSSNISLLTVSSEDISGRSLGVALRDGDAFNLTSLNHLNESVNALVTHTSDVCGHSQAGTEPVRDAIVPGRAMYLAMEVDSTFTSGIQDEEDVKANSLYVHFRDGSGREINRENPVWVTSVRNESLVYPYNFGPGINADRVTLPALQNPVVLRSVYAYNNGAVTVWLNAYDNDDINDNDEPAFSVPVPPGTRDLDIAKGMQFNTGLVMNSYTAPYDPNETLYGPGDNVLFVFGTFNLGSIFIDGIIVQASIGETIIEFGGYD